MPPSTQLHPATKEARKLLAAKIRDDFVFEWAPTSRISTNQMSGADVLAKLEWNEGKSLKDNRLPNAGIVAPVTALPNYSTEHVKSPTDTSAASAEVQPQSLNEPDDIPILSSVHQAVDLAAPQAFIGPVAEWRERYYAESDVSESPGDDQTAGVEKLEPIPPKERTSSGNSAGGLRNKMKLKIGIGGLLGKHGHWPNHLSAADRESAEEAFAKQAKTEEIKRRRTVRMEEEMEWNEGLAHWSAQRDAWCCAKTVRLVEPAAGRDIESEESPWTTEETDEEAKRTSGDSRYSAERRPTSAKSTTPSHSTSMSSSSSPIHDHPSTLNHGTVSSAQPTTTLLPLSTPLLPPSDPVRSATSPSLYSSIYSKVVVQSMAPTVPINLSDMIPALVQGWVKDGEWPPRSPFNPAPSTKPSTTTPATVWGRETAKSKARHRDALAKSAHGGNHSGGGSGHALMQFLDNGSSRIGRKGRRLLHPRSGGHSTPGSPVDTNASRAVETRKSDEVSGASGGRQTAKASTNDASHVDASPSSASATATATATAAKSTTITKSTSPPPEPAPLNTTAAATTKINPSTSSTPPANARVNPSFPNDNGKLASVTAAPTTANPTLGDEEGAISEPPLAMAAAAQS